MQHRPEIDGLRAIAVVPVVLFHANVPGFGGGFLGVDIFFVISGFLITSIIIADLRLGRFSIATFYERRARRILPALSVMMVACIPFAWLWMLPSELMNFGKSLLATALFVSNILYWRETNYFAPDAELNPLLHTWSLSVEEQFYVIFPLVFLMVWRLARRSIVPLLALGILLSLVMAIWAAENAPVAGFFLTPTRVFELLIGSTASWAVYKTGARSSDLASLLGLVMVIGSLLFLGDETSTPGLWNLVPVVGTALILLFARKGTWVATALGIRPVVGIGLISYSVYLWHQPLLAFAHIRYAQPVQGPLLIGLLMSTLLLGWLSWAFVEQPFRRRSSTPAGTQKVLVISAGSILATACVGFFLFGGDGYPWRETPSGIRYADLTAIENAIAPNYGLGRECDGLLIEKGPNCQTATEPEAVLWGDSYAMHLAQAIQNSPTEIDFVQITASQCGPIPGIAVVGSNRSWQSCLAFNDSVESWLDENTHISLVILSSPFNQSTGHTFRADGSVVRTPEDVRVEVRNSISALSERLNSRGVRLVVVGPPPQTGIDFGLCFLRSQAMGLADACNFTLKDAGIYSSASSAQIAQLEEVVPVIRLKELICPDGLCLSSLGQVSLYRDKGHLSIEGSAWLGAHFDLAAMILCAAGRCKDK